MSLKLYCKNLEARIVKSLDCHLKSLNAISQLFWLSMNFERKKGQNKYPIILNKINYSGKQNLFVIN